MFENLKTGILLAFMSAVLIILFGVIGLAFNFGYIGIIIGIVFAIIMNFVSYYYSDRIALSRYKAKMVTEQESPNLYRIIRDLTNRANLPMPRIAVVNSRDPNAFATGRNKDHATVAVTTALLQMLNEDELRGVLSHELGHVKNRDILISSVAATIAGMIFAVATYGRYVMYFNNRDNTAALVGGILLSILAPIAAALVQMAISRSREYKADATGAKICGNPLALASALRKIDYGVNQNPLKDAKPTDAHMFIHNPFGNAGNRISKLFSTHPSTADRIQRLESMAAGN